MKFIFLIALITSVASANSKIFNAQCLDALRVFEFGELKNPEIRLGVLMNFPSGKFGWNGEKIFKMKTFRGIEGPPYMVSSDPQEVVVWAADQFRKTGDGRVGDQKMHEIDIQKIQYEIIATSFSSFRQMRLGSTRALPILEGCSAVVRPEGLSRAPDIGTQAQKMLKDLREKGPKLSIPNGPVSPTGTTR